MKPIRLLKYPLLSLLLMVSLFDGCSIFQVYDLSPYPASSRTVFLYNLGNASFQPDVNRELTRQLHRELLARNNFILVEDRNEARFQLSGEISTYRLEGRMYDDYQDPTRYTIQTSALIRLYERAKTIPKKGEKKPGGSKEESEWLSGRIIFGREFLARTDYSVSQGFVETELQARERVMRKLASYIVTAMEEAYLSEAGSTGQ